MKIARPDLAMVALCALALVGIVVCALLGVAPPPVLEFVAMTSLGAGGGIALQSGSTPAPQENLQPAAASSSGSTANPPVPAPPPLPYEPTTGIIPRVSTHAP